ncbi:hypothetical protein DPMN_100508 [Dreissena polymorpha]|uniref:Uncharacterized protein n=1 Tax=Dreissena polymorpha TaxID=45954 RepID=A0A9D4LIC3_DREPO|nr:hypothetical protein DPMN_100508 [Dreissena polymorpha]
MQHFNLHNVLFQVKANEQRPSLETDSSSNDITFIVLEHSVIQEYYACETKPPITESPTKLHINREYTNIENKDACLVWCGFQS